MFLIQKRNEMLQKIKSFNTDRIADRGWTFILQIAIKNIYDHFYLLLNFHKINKNFILFLLIIGRNLLQ